MAKSFIGFRPRAAVHFEMRFRGHEPVAKTSPGHADGIYSLAMNRRLCKLADGGHAYGWLIISVSFHRYAVKYRLHDF